MHSEKRDKDTTRSYLQPQKASLNDICFAKKDLKRRWGHFLSYLYVKSYPPTNPNHQCMKKMGSNNFGIYQFVFLPLLGHSPNHKFYPNYPDFGGIHNKTTFKKLKNNYPN